MAQVDLIGSSSCALDDSSSDIVRENRYVRKAYADPNAEAIAYYLGSLSACLTPSESDDSYGNRSRARSSVLVQHLLWSEAALFSFYETTKCSFGQLTNESVKIASNQITLMACIFHLTETTPATRDSISPLSRSSPKVTLHTIFRLQLIHQHRSQTRPSTPSRTATPVHRQASPSRQSPFSQSPSLRSQLLAASPAGKRDYLSEQQAKERQLRERAFEARHMETSPGESVSCTGQPVSNMMNRQDEVNVYQ